MGGTLTFFLRIMESDGIKSILAAESEAAMEVKKARDERAAEISKARAEAIEDTRKAREMKEDMDKSEAQFSQNKKKVVDLMLGLVTTVDLKVPDTLKYKLKNQ